MGFWQGIAQAYKDEKVERTEDRRIEEQRAFQRETFNNQILEERRNAMLPLILEQRQAAQEEAQQREVWANFFRGRLEGVDGQTRDAFINIATSSPEIAKSLAESVQSVEETNGIRVEGQELVNFADIIKNTQPEGLSREEWTAQAAELSVASGSGIDLDDTLANLLAGDTQEDLNEALSDLYGMGGTSVVDTFVPDIDVTAVRGIDPSDYNNLESRAEKLAQTRLQEDLMELNAELSTYESESGPAELYKRQRELQILSQGGDPGVILRAYEDEILPELAKTEPRYRQVFPRFFRDYRDPGQEESVTNEQGNTITYEWINGDLFQTSGNQ